MNVIRHSAGALPGLPLAIVVAVASFALISSGAQAQSRVADVTVQAPVQGEEELPAEQRAQESESAHPGSAIYDPFSAGALARQERPLAASRVPSEPEPGLTMTLAASTAGAVALVWLLRRI